MTETEKKELLSLVCEYGRTCIYTHYTFQNWLKATDSAKLTKAKDKAEKRNNDTYKQILEFIADK